MDIYLSMEMTESQKQAKTLEWFNRVTNIQYQAKADNFFVYYGEG